MMVRKEAIIKNKTGLHARPAARFVQLTKKYQSELKLICDGREVNAKSIMGVLSIGAVKGKKVILVADGKDEKEAVAEMVQFIEDELSATDQDNLAKE